MRTSHNLLSLCLSVAFAGSFFAFPIAALSASNLIVNGDFQALTDTSTVLPAGWYLPPDSPWSRVDTDGFSGNASLGYNSKTAAMADPVTQKITLEQNADYYLFCAFKPDSLLNPVARLKFNGEEGREIVRIECQGKPEIWHGALVKFNSGAGGEVVLELWADVQHYSRKRARPAGKINISDVILAKDDGQLPTLPEKSKQTTALENVARNKQYTVNPPAAYSYTKDDSDKHNLTDGQYTTGFFWTQKTTVGWVRVPQAEITIDLEKQQPIRGISVNTAFGSAGVKPPHSIKMMVSNDMRNYHLVGDLVEMSISERPIPTGGYAVHRFFVDNLQVHGRYVKLIVELNGNTFFCDEIEIYRGEEALLTKPLPGAPTLYPREHFGRDFFNANWLRRVEHDRNTVSTLVQQQTELTPATKEQLLQKLSRLDAEVVKLPDRSSDPFYGIMPLNKVHAQIYGVVGEMRRLLGHPALVLGSAGPWDFLSPFDLPEPSSTAQITTFMMAGEERAAALNITNCTDQIMQACLTFTDLPGGKTPDYINISEVAWTDTNESILIAAALLPPVKTEQGWQVTLPAGMTRQVWLSFQPKDVPPGLLQGKLLVDTNDSRQYAVPVNLRIFDVVFPERPRLNVGGWDYTNGAMYGVTEENRDKLISFLKKKHVDTTWGTRGVLATGKYDLEGNLLEKPSTSAFDQWVNRWPEARRYQVFLRADAAPDIDGTQINEPLFGKKVAQWINFWAEHAAGRNIAPEQLCILIVDESGSSKNDEIIIAWAKAIKAAQPRVQIWDDGTRTPERNTDELRQAVDFLCPNRHSLRMKDAEKLSPEFYEQHVTAGGRLDLYSCSSRVKLRDPYNYFRLQAWDVFRLGGEGSQFWSFSGRIGSSWNEYEAFSPDFAPFFLEKNAVTNGKHMEAIRESVADFEYLAMLKDKIQQLQKHPAGNTLAAEAQQLLSEAVSKVLSSPDSYKEMWFEKANHELADQYRLKIGNLLEKLK